MAIIVPAILEKTKEDFNQRMSRVVKLPNLERIQVDFGDGKYIENKLLEAAEIDPLNPSFHWEAHLMVKEPQDFLDFQICGFKTIILHYEAFSPSSELKKSFKKLKEMGFKTGLAINPSTEVEVVKGLQVDQILVMCVVPGKQGQDLIPLTIDKVKNLRRLVPRAIIEVDGGINETNIKTLKNAGADLICAGSALVKAPNMLEAWDRLHEAMG